MFKKLISIAFFIALTINSFGQLNMTTLDYGVSNPINCASYILADPNFFDNGTSTNYANNLTDTFTICPDLTNNGKLNFSCLTGVGYIWNVDATDTLYIFDGPNTSAPLVAAINSVTNPFGYSYTSSFTNTTGCLTFVFHSNAATNNIGWAANIMCVSPPQPIDINLHAFVNGSSVDALLSDSVYIDICLGDSIKFTIDPQYPNSLLSLGYGYSQTDANVDVLWSWTTGETFSSVDTIKYVATTSSGFICTIKLTDIYPYNWTRDVYVRVGTIPNFGGLAAIADTSCLGDQVTLFGGYNAITHENYGFTIPEGVIAIGGEVAGITYLPDGNGLSYTSVINIDGFTPGQVLSGSCGLQSICIDMEHSYIGDLSATITCPNGTNATLFDAFNNFNSGTYLGEPDESDGPIPGNGYNYCFTDNAAMTLQTGATSNTVALTNPPAPATGTTIAAGQYIPAEIFSTNLAGCPLNGNWTVTITDHQAIDNGYIFNWSVAFAACNYANNDSLTYQNTVASGGYINVSPTLSSTDSTKVTIPQNLGNNPYTFHIIDDFGCPHDTIINAFVHFVDVIETDTACTGSYTMTTNTASLPGTWGFYNSPGTPVFASNTNINTSVTLPTPGIYHLVYSSTSPCVAKDTFTLYYFGYEPFKLNAPFHNCPDVPHVYTIGNAAQFDSVDWNLNIPALDHLFSNTLAVGTYTITGYGKNSCPYDTTFTITTQAPVVLNYSNLVCWDSLEMSLNTGPTATGNWTFIGPTSGSTATFRAIDSLNTGVKLSQNYGTWHLIFTESSTCHDDDTLTFISTPGTYVEIPDYKLCLGNSVTIESVIPYPEFLTSILWNTGATSPTISVSSGGLYYLTVTNACQSSTDSSKIDAHICDIEMPNVFSPNGDGINDLYHIKGDKEIFKKFNIVIVNRWGNLINEYEDPNGNWDGTDNKGSLVPEGVYFYSVKSITLQDEELLKQGFIEVIYEKK